MFTESNVTSKLTLVPSKAAFKVEILALSFICSLFFIACATISLFAFHSFLNSAFRLLIIITTFLLITFFVYLIKIGTNARMKCRRYEITQDQVITYDGISSCNQYISNLKGMIGMELTETALGKYFNYGTIVLKFLGGSEVTISNIDHPEKYIPKITEIVAKGTTTLD